MEHHETSLTDNDPDLSTRMKKQAAAEVDALTKIASDMREAIDPGASPKKFTQDDKNAD